MLGAAVVVAKAPAWARVVTLFGMMAWSAYLAFGLGTSVTRSVYMSTHVYWFSKYSSYLSQLVDSGNIKDLTNTVRFFDQRFQQNRMSETNIQDTMSQIFEIGPYYKPQNLESNKSSIINHKSHV